jgi:hypothetical protein
MTTLCEYQDLVARAQNDPTLRKTVSLVELIKAEQELGLKSQVKPDTSKLDIAIIGYKSKMVAPWDPFTTEMGLPGSEECAVYASQELANRGHRVTLYMNPPEDSIWRSSFSNPRWVPVEEWDSPANSDTYDLVLMWRRFDVDAGRKRGKKVFFWGHDSPPVPGPGFMLPPFPKFDGLCILSEHHKRQFMAWPEFGSVPITISGNGIVPKQFGRHQSMNPLSLGYFSNYARGLIILMAMWPQIRAEFPTATLGICYGRETWATMPPQEFDFVIQCIEKYKDQGITEHGKVGHEELARIMQSTSIWAYPCTAFGETFCITATKCQAAGCIPVTTRIAALNETVHPEAPNFPQIRNNAEMAAYKAVLCATLRRVRDGKPEEIKKERQKYIDFAMKFSWAACVDKWLALYEKVK